eukprot:m.91878 g.91878  ORF g.91878 m.91878 type:complete len:599 (-) comp14922_c0_seq3:13-1809(-)
MTLAFDNVCWQLQDKGCSRTILNSVHGQVAPGELLAIMGPSGAGKTTLLQLLSGRVPCPPRSSITLNGNPLTKRHRRAISYVTQSDLLFDNLTVLETLQYAALLKLPSTMTREAKLLKAQQILSNLGLDKVANSRIGGEAARGISGGEKKRVNVGVELLSQPQVLVLDEPTTGLDSSTALALVQLLTRLSKSMPCSVVLSIHQPSSQVYRELDRLLLLSHGQQVYFGPVSNALPTFAMAGMHCHSDYNPADFFLEVLSNPAFVNRLSQQAMLPNASPQASSSSLQTSLDIDTVIASGTVVASAVDNSTRENHTIQWPCTWQQQVKVLTSRNFKQSRGRMLTIGTLSQTVLMSLVVAVIWFQIPAEEQFVDDWLGYYFFNMVYWCLHMLVPTAQAMLSERVIVRKERAAGTYQLSAYLVAKLLSELPVLVVLPSLYLLLTYPIIGLLVGPGGFVVWLTLLLSTWVAQSMGLFLGSVVDKPKTATVLAGTLLSSSVVLGGFYVDRFPSGLGWLKYLSIVYYGYQAPLVYHLTQSSTAFTCGSQASSYEACRAGSQSSTFSGRAVLELYEIDSRLWIYYLGLLSLLVVFWILTYFTLKLRR